MDGWFLYRSIALITGSEDVDNPKCLEVRAVFLDPSKTFDKVWHEGLIYKPKENGIFGHILKFFESYLHNRKQRVVLNGCYPEYSLITFGVPDGVGIGSSFVFSNILMM